MHMASDSTGALKELEVHSQVNMMAVGMFRQFMVSGEMVEMNPAVANEMFRFIMMGAMELAFATDPRPASLEEIEQATETIVLRAFVVNPS